MNIRFKCADCGKEYKVSSQFAGKKVKCKKCGAKIRVPDADADAETPAKTPAKTASTRASTKTAKPASARSSSRSSGSSAKRKRSTGRVSAEKAASARSSSSKTSTKTSPKPASARKTKSSKSSKRSAGGTEIIEVPDLTAEKKVYDSKRKDDQKLERGTGRLVYFEDGKPVKSHRLNRDARVIGRGASCDITLTDESVSSEHCRLECRLGKFTMTDLQSSNGVLVNFKKVRRAALNNGDIIQLGRAIFRIDCG